MSQRPPLLVFPGPDGEEMHIPARYEVCGTCQGNGSHVNRSVDGNGITAEEMIELGDDFREDYLSGVYDVACEECDGLRVVPVPDEGRATAEQIAAYDSHMRDEIEYHALVEAERRVGA